MITKEKMAAYIKARENGFVLEQEVKSGAIATITVEKGSEDEHDTSVLFLEYVDGTSSMIFLDTFPQHDKTCFDFIKICKNIEKHGEKAVTNIKTVGKGRNRKNINFFGIAGTYNDLLKNEMLSAVKEAYAKHHEGAENSAIAEDMLEDTNFDTLEGYSTLVENIEGTKINVYVHHSVYRGENAIFFDINEYKGTFAGICGKDELLSQHPDFEAYHTNVKKTDINGMKYLEAFKAEIESFEA